MKYLCLAYGDAKSWNALPGNEREALLAQDQRLRDRGDTVASVEEPTTVQAQQGVVAITNGPFAQSRAPLAGFSIIEANDLSEAIELMSNTPCARAGGAVVIWPARGL